MTRLTDRINNLNPIVQNIVMGTVTGLVMGFFIKELYRITGGWNLVWLIIVLIGPLIGYFSGKERLRLEKTKLEKALLEEDIDKMQVVYKQTMNKYRLLFDNISDAIYLTTEDGRFLMFNEATCLMAGYSREELKAVRVSQLQMEEEPVEAHRRAWLDNGICRYEERWKTNNGKILYLDVNSKWIKLAQNQYILHVARDILRKFQAGEEKKTDELRQFQFSKLEELTRSHQVLYRQILSPVTNAFGLLNDLAKKHPAEEKKIRETFLEWDKVKKFLQVLVAKNARDLQTVESEWNLNEVLRQELHYLETIAYDQNIMVNTRFASNLPNLHTTGRPFSIVFGNLFLAAMKMLGKAQKRQMTVATRMQEDQILAELHLQESNAFEKALSEIVDPSFSEQDPTGTGRGLAVLNMLLVPLNGKVELIQIDNNGVVVRVMISASKNRIHIPEDGKNLRELKLPKVK